MIQGFLDGSRDKLDRYLTVAGCFGTTQAWCHFQEKWQGVRQRLGVPFFHMTDFMSSSAPPYKSLAGSEKYAIIKELVALAGEHQLFVVAVALNLCDFYAMSSEDQAVAENNPYGLCAAQLIGLLLKYLEDFNIDETVSYAFEVGGDGESALVQAMDELMTLIPEVKTILRVHSVVRVHSKKDIPALDLADVLAWVYNNAAPTWTERVSIGTFSSMVMQIPNATHLIYGPSLKTWIDENRELPPHLAYGHSIYGRIAARTRRGISS